VSAPFRDNRVHVLSEKCSTCIFRPGNQMHLTPGRVREMVDASLEQDAGITCHQTLSYGGYDVPGEAVCRGFFDAHGERISGLRLAVGLGIVVEQEPPTERREIRSLR